ncbi:MAG: hypothetical protein ACP5KA_07010 [Desulfurococcaceae archaeon]
MSFILKKDKDKRMDPTEDFFSMVREPVEQVKAGQDAPYASLPQALDKNVKEVKPSPPGNQAVAEPPLITKLDEIINALREAGVNPKPLEELKNMTLELDNRIQMLEKEIELKKKQLETLRYARSIVSKMGI